MSEQRRAFLAWRRHLEEVIGVDDASVVDDEIATRSWMATEFARSRAESRAERRADLHEAMNRQTWRVMGLMVAQTGIFVALVPLLT